MLKALFIDFDSFFASVEQHQHPKFRGKPLGVLPVMSDTSTCIAASYEAKRYGVKTGTRVFEAREMCPDIRFIEAKHEVYVHYHHRLIEVISECLPVETVLSIDEMWCRLPAHLSGVDEAYNMAQRIKARIAEEVSSWITCSIGVAENRWIAKVASKMNKPDGIKIIQPSEMPEALWELELTDLHGIGKGMLERLAQRRITTVQQLSLMPCESLRKIWGGVEGVRFWQRMNGYEVPDKETSRGSFGHSHVLAPENRVPHRALAILHRLLQKGTMRLRSEKCVAGGVGLQLKFEGGLRWAEEVRLIPTDDTLKLTQCLQHLWRHRAYPDRVLLKVSVVLNRAVTKEGSTPTLFKWEQQPKHERLMQALDQVALKHGKKALYLGGAHGAMETAKMKISFNHVPNPELEM